MLKYSLIFTRVSLLMQHLVVQDAHASPSIGHMIEGEWCHPPLLCPFLTPGDTSEYEHRKHVTQVNYMYSRPEYVTSSWQWSVLENTICEVSYFDFEHFKSLTL
jgi:hypothetical protein